MNIRFTLGAVIGIALFSYGVGLVRGTRIEQHRAEEQANREDVFDQFVDILADSLDEDGEVWYD